MAKISIITRALNRLEYTTRCIDSIKQHTNSTDYEHIIINNNSDDGTTQWLNWVKNHNLSHFKNVKPINMDKNYGDWGGMLESLNHISPDSEYIVQLDNDIEVKDPEWINKCIFMLENTEAKIVQLRRIGVRQNVTVYKTRKIAYNNEELVYGNINRPVAMFMLKTEDFRRLASTLPLDLGSGKIKLANLLGNNTIKIKNLLCYIMDGHDGSNTRHILNYDKYPPKFVHAMK